MFAGEDRTAACRAALAAAQKAFTQIAELQQRRLASGLPATDLYLGLHLGEVVCGNFGSRERLDFTVVGPAVNEVSRIAGMCRLIDQPILASSAFFAALGSEQRRLVSVGRYALRGVGQPQDLFTLDRGKLSSPVSPAPLRFGTGTKVATSLRSANGPLECAPRQRGIHRMPCC